MKSIYYQILKIMSEFYPAWVVYLNENLSRKKSTLEAYRSVIAETWPLGIVSQLKKWLEGPLNMNYRKWPPTPTRLGCIIEKLIKHKKMIPQSASNPELFIHRLVALFCTGHKNIFNERNIYLKPFVVQMVDCMIHNRHLYYAAFHFVEIFREMRQTSLPYPLFEKMLLRKNRKLLISQIGPVDIPILMKFLWKTQWDAEISKILDNWYV